MTKIEIIPEKDVWPLVRLRANGWTQDKFPIIVLGGEVAVNAALPVETASIICATHRTNLVPDFSTLSAAKTKLERVCPIPDCQTRAIVEPHRFPPNFRIRESWNHIKRCDAQSYLRIHGPKPKSNH